MSEAGVLHSSRSGVAVKTSSSVPPTLRFGVFELDPQAGELRKKGMKIRLQGQPVEILAMLLQRPGETITREELQKKLWPADTFVDFEQGLNNAMKRLRAALDDSAESPRFVETLPRRGYRFIATLEGTPGATEEGQNPSVLLAESVVSGAWRESFARLWAYPESRGRPSYRSGVLILLALLVLASGVWLFYSARRSVPVTSPSEYEQITNFTDSAVAPSLSPDGRMVTFKRGEDAFFSTGQIYVKLLPNGESVRLTSDSDYKYAPVFTPDGSRVAYTSVNPLTWDTWTVPVLGGQPTRLLPNASGLTWITDRQVLFSEIKTDLHMGIVTSTEGRADRREIYSPANERAMAHYAYVSPDHRWVLVVEMDQTHMFHQPCRLVPFDGSSGGGQVGPRGTCTAAAWSPDGKWMYFSVTVGNNSHLWRQKFPDEAPEQITFGPSEEEGLALAPDGRSLVTSVGTRRSALWIHDAAGERAISSESYALAPHLSRDGRRVFYLFARNLVLSAEVGWMTWSGELHSVDLSSGKTDSVLPGVSVRDYDISGDEKEVAFTTGESGGESQIWLASLDRSKPPRQITRGGDQVSFGADGDLIFRSLEEKTNGLVRIKKDGRERERITTTPVLEKFGVSPDGEWVIVLSPGVGEDVIPAALAVPIHGGAPKKVCTPDCWSGWSSDGRFFYVAIPRGEKTLVIPVPAGKSLPHFPASGINMATSEAELPGARVIERGSITLGPDPSQYVFVKTELQRNLFRIPLH